MSMLESAIYGLVSGFSEFSVISPQGHQSLLMLLFGLDNREFLRDLLVHIGTLASVFFSCRRMMVNLRREQLIASRSRRNPTYTRTGISDIKLVKSAIFPMVLLLLLYFKSKSIEHKPLVLALAFLLNGIFLLIPEHLPRGNKDSRSMSGLDSVLIGFISGLSCLPGLSRISLAVGVSTVRGAERKYGYNWALLLSIPALILFIIFDLYSLFSVGLGTVSFVVILGYLLSAIMAFVSGCTSISLMYFLIERTGLSAFAYYSFGAALFSVVLYLIA